MSVIKKVMRKTVGNLFKTGDGVIGIANPLAGQAAAVKDTVHEIRKEGRLADEAEKLADADRIRQADDDFEAKLDAARRSAGRSRVVFAGLLGENAIGLGGKKSLLGL